MTLSTVRLGHTRGDIARALAELRVQLEITEEFPAAVLAEAERMVAEHDATEHGAAENNATEHDAATPKTAKRAATHPDAGLRDLRELPFVTIDPADSMDLDQAMQLERRGDGYLVRYAIADVAAFVLPGGALDAEARRRGQTLYPPDGRIPLHPPILSEGAASLLPGELRRAYVWAFELDAEARVTVTRLERALVRSTARFDYAHVQALVDAGDPPKWVGLLREIGLQRVELERERGGASLGRPDQEIRESNGGYVLVRRQPLAVETWNAQISLMTGMSAATLMLDGGVGILRTMPPPTEESIASFRRTASALGSPWRLDVPYGEYLRRLNPAAPAELAIMHAAASLFRGAGYTAFDGEAPEVAIQSAVAAPYAHATAPLRRLVDRFVLVVCEALAQGREVPGWAREALPQLPAIMAASDNLAGRLDRESLDRVEAAVLRSHVGEVFSATVLSKSKSKGGGRIQLDDPAVTAECAGKLVAGERIRARLARADVATGEVRFRLAT